jgi:hypothetical protein
MAIQSGSLGAMKRGSLKNNNRVSFGEASMDKDLGN